LQRVLGCRTLSANFDLQDVTAALLELSSSSMMHAEVGRADIDTHQKTSICEWADFLASFGLASRSRT
jgi:hypothetical protein